MRLLAVQRCRQGPGGSQGHPVRRGAADRAALRVLPIAQQQEKGEASTAALRMWCSPDSLTAQ